MPKGRIKAKRGGRAVRGAFACVLLACPVLAGPGCSALVDLNRLSSGGAKNTGGSEDADTEAAVPPRDSGADAAERSEPPTEASPIDTGTEMDESFAGEDAPAESDVSAESGDAGADASDEAPAREAGGESGPPGDAGGDSPIRDPLNPVARADKVMLEDTPLVGGTGGVEHSELCPDNPGEGVVVGYRIWPFTGYDIDGQVQTLWAAMSNTHAAVTIAAEVSSIEPGFGTTNSASPYDLKCPANAVVVGFEADAVSFDPDTFAHLRSIHCQTFAITPIAQDGVTVADSLVPGDIVSVSAGADGGLTVTPLGPADAGRSVTDCPAGWVAVGSHFRSGNWIDAVGVTCGRLYLQ